MLLPLPRALARTLCPWLGALLLGGPNLAAATDAPLAFDEVERLAVDAQPQLIAQAALARAQDERAIAAGELPDPQLTAAVQDLPINTDAAYSLRRDDFTMLRLGLMQEFPRAAKRSLRSAQERLRADAARDQLDELTRRIRREAALAALHLYEQERGSTLVTAMLAEAERSREALEIGYRAGRNESSELLAATVARGLLRDRAAESEQMVSHARRALARWIGPPAERPMAELPAWPQPPPLDAVLAALPAHPALRLASRERAVADNQLAQARKATLPDWRLELGYGYREAFAELVTLQVGVDLPLFAGRRQHRDTAAAHAELDSADARREDALRALSAEATLAHHDWERVRRRRVAFDDDVLKPAQTRVQAALAVYGAGRGALGTLLDARRMLLDAQLQALKLDVEAARLRIGLQYFLPDSP